MVSVTDCMTHRVKNRIKSMHTEFAELHSYTRRSHPTSYVLFSEPVVIKPCSHLTSKSLNGIQPKINRIDSTHFWLQENTVTSAVSMLFLVTMEF